MKNTLIITIFSTVLCGCTTPVVSSYVEKQVVVTKDSEGKVVSRVETEKVVQPLLAKPIQVEYLTGLIPDNTNYKARYPKNSPK